MKHFYPSIIITALIITQFVPTFASADTVYKSVDKDGKVSYSSSPKNKQSSVPVKILPPPSEKAVNAAKERHDKNLKTEAMLGQYRQEREKNIAEQNQLKREKRAQAEANSPAKEAEEQGPYYGIPGHGILVLPKGPTINR